VLFAKICIYRPLKGNIAPLQIRNLKNAHPFASIAKGRALETSWFHPVSRIICGFIIFNARCQALLFQ
jgi:hypothetical protein